MRNFKRIAFLYVVLIIAITISCTNKKADLVKKGVAASDPLCDTTMVSYKNDIAPMIVTYCMFSGCHNDNGPLDSYNFVSFYVTQQPKSLSYYVNNTSSNYVMPKPTTPGPKIIAPCDLAKLNAWMNAGALDN